MTSSKLQTEPSPEVSPLSADPSGPKEQEHTLVSCVLHSGGLPAVPGSVQASVRGLQDSGETWFSKRGDSC